MTKLMGPGAMAVPSDLEDVTPPGPMPDKKTSRRLYLTGRRKSFDPMFDSFIVRAGVDVEEQLLFAVPQGMTWYLDWEKSWSKPEQSTDSAGPKTSRDTNFMVSGSLGYPLYAYWTWMKVVFERWDNPSDAAEVLTTGEIRLTIGTHSRVIPLSNMTPILPDGADKDFGKKISKSGFFWPWLKLDVGPYFVSSTHIVDGRLRVKGIRAGRVQGKVILGPTLYVPERS